MSIIRIKKEREYVSIANAILQDKTLSWEARGVMAYLLSKPDGWECRNYDLVNQGSASAHIIRRVLKELQKAGYIYRYRKSEGRGKIEWITEIYETPELNTTLRNVDLSTIESYDVESYDVEKSVDIVSPDSSNNLPSKKTDNISPNGGNGSANTDKQPESFIDIEVPCPYCGQVECQSSDCKKLTDKEANELLILGKHPDSDAANPSFDTIQEIKAAGWQVRNHIVEQAIAYYLEAVREHHTTFAVPNNVSVRKDWYSTINGHLQDHRVDDLKVIYPATIERLKERGMTFSRPGSLTKSLPDVAMETQTGDVVAWL